MKLAGVAIILAALVAFAAGVWPTRYRVEQGALRGQPVTLRTDRFSGEVQYLTPVGWRRIAQMTAGVPTGSRNPCTPEEVQRLQGNMFADLICEMPTAAAPRRTAE